MHDRKQIPPVRRLPQSASPNANAIKQQRMMVAAFIMLVIALTAVLYHDRDFWFPDQQLVQEQPDPTSPVSAASTSPVPPKQAPVGAKARAHHRAAPEPEIPQEPGPAVTTVRTVLPPLDVEVIGRDGLIQELRLVSGAPILAGAAQEAVRQWHFKPHYIGAEPVETQAKITVNFTISTN